MSVALHGELRAADIARLEGRIQRLRDGLGQTEPLMAALAAELESQARRRIESDKAGPDGSAWERWKAGYAATRHGGQSLLQSGGGLLDSLQSFHDAATAEAGSPLVYAAIQQLGGKPDMPAGPRNVQARPYLGFEYGTADGDALQALVDDWANDAIEEGLRQ